MKMTGERFVPKRMQALAEIEHMHRYYSIGEVLENKIVLDAACGTGYGTNIIAKKAKKAYGIDISDEAIQYAKENYCAENLYFQQGSVAMLEFPDHFFDVVISFETIEHVDEEMQNQFLSEIYRVLKEDGILIMSTPDKKIYTDLQVGEATEWHVKEFYAEEFTSFINTRFQYFKFYNQYMCQTSQILDSSEDNLKKINYDDREGKFIIILASNNADAINQSIASSYYCSDEFQNLDDFVQVYFENNQNAFSEQQYQMKEISRKKGTVSEKIWIDGERLSSIRIDPLSISCELIMNKIEIGLSNGEIREIRKYVTNADFQNGKYLVFYHNDPQIIFNLEQENLINYIFIDFEILDYNINLYALYAGLKEELAKMKIEAKSLEDDYRDKLLFEKGKNCSLIEERDRKDFKISELESALIEQHNINAILAEHFRKNENI